MQGLEIRPFSDAHLDDAARLLAERHERHRKTEPLLPGGVDYRGQIERELEDATGVVAIANGSLDAYVIGRSTDEDCVVGLAGCAAREPELIRDLYEKLAASWVRAGRRQHRVYVPASDSALVDTWFRLAFGLQFTYAVRETASEPMVDAAAIRPGEPRDLEVAASLDRMFSEHLRASPSFSERTLRSHDELQENWRDTWSDPDFTHFVAERDGHVVGQVLLYRRPTGDLRIPEESIDLALMTTHPDVRGTGVGLALTAHSLTWAYENGYRAMTIDWRVVNLVASRFFAQRGFRPTFFRLYRHVP